MSTVTRCDRRFKQASVSDNVSGMARAWSHWSVETGQTWQYVVLPTDDESCWTDIRSIIEIIQMLKRIC